MCFFLSNALFDSLIEHISQTPESDGVCCGPAENKTKHHNKVCVLIKAHYNSAYFIASLFYFLIYLFFYQPH